MILVKYWSSTSPSPHPRPGDEAAPPPREYCKTSCTSLLPDLTHVNRFEWHYRSVCNILFELLLFAELLGFKATTTRWSFKMAPPQSWPEFKLTNYPGHYVSIIVLSNEHFNQKNIPESFICGGRWEGRDSTFTFWANPHWPHFAARTTPGAHAPSLPRTSKILITSLATRCKSICLLEFSRYEWAAAFKVLLVALLCGAWIVWFVHWRMFLWGKL